MFYASLVTWMDGWSNWVYLARYSFGVLPVCLFKFVCSNNTIGTFYSCGMVSSCFNHTFMLDVLIHIVSIFYVLCMLDGWSNWVDLARSSFGVLSVYFFPKLSVVTIQLEHSTLVEWCLVVLFLSYLSIAIVFICICLVTLCLIYLCDQFN